MTAHHHPGGSALSARHSTGNLGGRPYSCQGHLVVIVTCAQSLQLRIFTVDALKTTRRQCDGEQASMSQEEATRGQALRVDEIAQRLKVSSATVYTLLRRK